MDLEVAVGALAEDLLATRPEVGQPGHELLGRRGRRLVEVDGGHRVLHSFASGIGARKADAQRRPSRPRGPWSTPRAIGTGRVPVSRRPVCSDCRLASTPGSARAPRGARTANVIA